LGDGLCLKNDKDRSLRIGMLSGGIRQDWPTSLV
jgi:hypothetical protein